VTLRDHGAIQSGALMKALLDLSEEQWFGELSRRVFFFTNQTAARTLIRAYSSLMSS
jgi:hypothetical protein